MNGQGKIIVEENWMKNVKLSSVKGVIVISVRLVSIRIWLSFGVVLWSFRNEQEKKIENVSVSILSIGKL